MHEEKYLEEIELYFSGKMSIDKKKEFRQRLENDDKLAEIFWAYQATEEIIEREIYKDIKQQMKNWDEPTKQSKKHIVFRLLLLFTVIISLLFGAYFAYQYYYPSNTVIAQKFYKAYDVSSIKGNPTTNDKRISAIKKSYTNKEFSISSSLIIAFLRDSFPNDYQYQYEYLLGHSLMQEKKWREASVVFEKIMNSNNRKSESAQWNYILAKILNNEKDIKFQEELNKIIGDSGHAYHAKALELTQVIHRNTKD